MKLTPAQASTLHALGESHIWCETYFTKERRICNRLVALGLAEVKQRGGVAYRATAEGRAWIKDQLKGARSDE